MDKAAASNGRADGPFRRCARSAVEPCHRRVSQSAVGDQRGNAIGRAELAGEVQRGIQSFILPREALPLIPFTTTTDTAQG